MEEKANTDTKFETLFEMMCQMHNGGHTERDQADDKSMLPATPPGLIRQANIIKGLTKTWKTEEVQFDNLTIPERNRTQSANKNLVKNKSEIDPEEVWVELGQGSLVVAMDVGATGFGEWPEDHELTTATRNALAGNVADRINRRQGANRTDGHDPWQPVMRHRNPSQDRSLKKAG